MGAEISRNGAIVLILLGAFLGASGLVIGQAGSDILFDPSSDPVAIFPGNIELAGNAIESVGTINGVPFSSLLTMADHNMFVNRSGDTITGNLNLSGYNITDVDRINEKTLTEIGGGSGGFTIETLAGNSEEELQCGGDGTFLDRGMMVSTSRNAMANGTSTFVIEGSVYGHEPTTDPDHWAYVEWATINLTKNGNVIKSVDTADWTGFREYDGSFRYNYQYRATVSYDRGDTIGVVLRLNRSGNPSTGTSISCADNDDSAGYAVRLRRIY